MTLWKSLRHLGLLAVAAGVFALAALMLTLSGNAARSAEAANDNMSVTSVTDNSPPAVLLAEISGPRHDGGVKLNAEQSIVAGPMTMPARDATISIGDISSRGAPAKAAWSPVLDLGWAIPLIMTGAILHWVRRRDMLFLSGRWTTTGTNRKVKKGNLRRSSAGMRPWFVAGL